MDNNNNNVNNQNNQKPTGNNNLKSKSSILSSSKSSVTSSPSSSPTSRLSTMMSNISKSFKNKLATIYLEKKPGSQRPQPQPIKEDSDISHVSVSNSEDVSKSSTTTTTTPEPKMLGLFQSAFQIAAKLKGRSSPRTYRVKGMPPNSGSSSENSMDEWDSVMSVSGSDNANANKQKTRPKSLCYSQNAAHRTKSLSKSTNRITKSRIDVENPEKSSSFISNLNSSDDGSSKMPVPVPIPNVRSGIVRVQSSGLQQLQQVKSTKSRQTITTGNKSQERPSVKLDFVNQTAYYTSNRKSSGIANNKSVSSGKPKKPSSVTGISKATKDLKILSSGPAKSVSSGKPKPTSLTGSSNIKEILVQCENLKKLSSRILKSISSGKPKPKPTSLTGISSNKDRTSEFYRNPKLSNSELKSFDAKIPLNKEKMSNFYRNSTLSASESQAPFTVVVSNNNEKMSDFYRNSTLSASESQALFTVVLNKNNEKMSDFTPNPNITESQAPPTPTPPGAGIWIKNKKVALTGFEADPSLPLSDNLKRYSEWLAMTASDKATPPPSVANESQQIPPPVKQWTATKAASKLTVPVPQRFAANNTNNNTTASNKMRSSYPSTVSWEDSAANSQISASSSSCPDLPVVKAIWKMKIPLPPPPTPSSNKANHVSSGKPPSTIRAQPQVPQGKVAESPVIRVRIQIESDRVDLCVCRYCFLKQNRFCDPNFTVDSTAFQQFTEILPRPLNPQAVDSAEDTAKQNEQLLRMLELHQDTLFNSEHSSKSGGTTSATGSTTTTTGSSISDGKSEKPGNDQSWLKMLIDELSDKRKKEELKRIILQGSSSSNNVKVDQLKHPSNLPTNRKDLTSDILVSGRDSIRMLRESDQSENNQRLTLITGKQSSAIQSQLVSSANTTTTTTNSSTTNSSTSGSSDNKSISGIERMLNNDETLLDDFVRLLEVRRRERMQAQQQRPKQPQQRNNNAQPGQTNKKTPGAASPRTNKKGRQQQQTQHKQPKQNKK